jgi:hypothetical protein
MWATDNVAHAMPVHGDSSIVRLVRFNWQNPEKLYLRAGNYSLIFHFWQSGKERPTNSEHHFQVTQKMFDKLEEFRKAKNKRHIDLTFDKKIESSREMTEHEYKMLLGE